mgnify:CR=1 FL=1
MAKLIVKSPYIDTGAKANGYMEYIATREGVECYMSYIASRPGAEKKGMHGLFGDADNVDLEKAMEEVSGCKGRVWTHIISLHREDAARLGFDSMSAWRNLLKTHRNDIAAAMKIKPNNFRWYAAFHNEENHPHVHMMAWSADSSQGYLTKQGISDIKSGLANDIFKQEMLCLYKQKSVSRDELVREARKAMTELIRQMNTDFCDHPEVERLLSQLAQCLETVQGKKQYGYLPQATKRLVDEIINQMERLSVVAQCYDNWWKLSEQVRSYYTGEPRDRPPLSRQKEFRSIKNAVIQEAEHIRLNNLTFEDEDTNQLDEAIQEPKPIYEIAKRYRRAKNIIFGEAESLEQHRAAVQEMRALAENGYLYAQYRMGIMYRDRIGALPDVLEAKRWFLLAAEQNVTAAQYALGKLCLSDDTEVRDISEGIHWMQKAFENSSSWAGYQLGKEYLLGKNVQKNATATLEYLTQSAEAGNPCAQYLLGKLFLTGREIPKDENMARYWLSLSAEQGNRCAGFLLKSSEQARNPDLMLAATRLLHHLGRIFQEHSLPPSNPAGMRIDSKRRKKLMEKKQAMGHAYDDHEENCIHFTGY